MSRFVIALFSVKLAIGTPFWVGTVLGAEFGVADDTAPPASPYHPAVIAHRHSGEPASLGKADVGRVADRRRHDEQRRVLRRALSGHAKASLELS